MKMRPFMHHFSSNLFENHSHGRTLAFFFMVLSLYLVCVCLDARKRCWVSWVSQWLLLLLLSLFRALCACVMSVCPSLSFSCFIMFIDLFWYTARHFRNFTLFRILSPHISHTSDHDFCVECLTHTQSAQLRFGFRSDAHSSLLNRVDLFQCFRAAFDLYSQWFDHVIVFAFELKTDWTRAARERERSPNEATYIFDRKVSIKCNRIAYNLKPSQWFHMHTHIFQTHTQTSKSLSLSLLVVHKAS